MAPISGGLFRGLPKISVITEVVNPFPFNIEEGEKLKSKLFGSVNNGLAFQKIV
jgi:hypothetical protein